MMLPILPDEFNIDTEWRVIIWSDENDWHDYPDDEDQKPQS